MIKRTLCLLLSLLLMLGCLTACGSETQAAPAEKTDSEIQKAIELGLVPESLQKDYDAQINYAEYCSVLDSFVSAMFPEAMPEWQKASAKFHDAEDMMSRMEGAVVLLYAAECCGVDALGYDANIPLEDLYEGPDFMEGVTWNYPLLPKFRNELYYNQTLAESEHYGWRNGHDYSNNAKWFVEYLSYGNGRTYFDYDENWSLNLGDAYTRGDAIRAVERFYENARFAKFIPVSEAICTVSDAALSLAAQMPEASWQHLPEWKGYTVTPGNWTAGYGAGMLYEKDFIALLGDYGFDFIRAPLDSRVIFAGSDMSRVSLAWLENMDDLIEYCAEEGIHVCFDLHDMPGFYTGGDDSKITLWDDEETQKIFVEFWRFLAEYYKDVPSNLLSFNLLNEPHSHDEGPTDELYSEIMLRAISAIRETNPERLIFVDTIQGRNFAPVHGLEKAQIVQTIHSYFLIDGTKQWPAYTIGNFMHKGDSVLSLNGSFPAGTKITFDIAMVHADSTFNIEADGKTISTIKLGTERIGENGCIFIGEEGTGGEFRHYEGISITADLPESCGRIKFVQQGGLWYFIERIRLETDNYTTEIIANDHVVSSGGVPPTLHIDETGEVSAANEGELVTQSRQWLEDYLAVYRKFTEETGTLFMVQEFGFHPSIDHQASLAAADDFLSVLDEYNIPWCSWTDGFGPLMDNRSQEFNRLLGWGPNYIKEGAEYQMVSENWMADTGMMEVFQKHMN